MQILRNSILILLSIGFLEVVISIWFSDTLSPLLASIGFDQDLMSKIFVTEIVTGLCLFITYIILSLQRNRI